MTGTKYWYKDKATAQTGRGQSLPDRYRRLFANKQVVCIEYQDLPDSDEREIFQVRIQLSPPSHPVPTYASESAARDGAHPRRYVWPYIAALCLGCILSEKLQVINTPMAAFVRKLQSEYFHLGSPLDGEGSGFDWDRSRGGDFRCIAQALYVIAKYPSSSSIGTIVQVEKWLHNPTTRPYARSRGKKRATDEAADKDLSNDEVFLERVHSTFRTFSHLVGDPSLHPHFLKPEWRVSPIEFVMMCLLISVKRDSSTSQELAVKIGDMRTRVRKEHVDVRMNSRVAKTLFDVIKETPDTPQHPEPTTSGIKRKREEEEVVLPARKEKELRGDEGTSAPASPASSVLPPSRPDRPLAVREARKVIAPPRVSTLPSTPVSLR